MMVVGSSAYTVLTARSGTNAPSLLGTTRSLRRADVVALHWINKDVPGFQEQQIDADNYYVRDEFIHFADEFGTLLTSISKSAVQLIVRC